MRIILLLSALSILFASCDKEEISVKQSETFVKFYGANLQDEGVQVISLVEGGYLVMANIETSGSGKDICLITTDKFGNSTLPMQVYGNIFDDFGYKIKKNDKGYIIAGSTEHTRGGTKDVLLIQISPTGKELWQKTLGSAFNEEVYDFLILDNGNMIFTGYTDSTKSSTKDILFLETDNVGEIIYYKSNGYDEKDEIAYAISAAANGQYVFAGTTNSRPKNSLSTNLLILPWDGINNKPDVIFVEMGGNSRPSAIISNSPNEYYVCCNVSNAAEDISNCQIVKMQIGNNILVDWKQEFGENNHTKINCLQLKDNKLYMLGTSGTSSDFGDIVLISAKSDGTSPKYSYTGDGISYTGDCFDFVSDGGFIITGSNRSNEVSVITLIKLDKETL